MRNINYIVIVDARSYEFGSGGGALEFAHLAARHITKKSWETELPEVAIKIIPIEPEEIEAEPEEPEVVEEVRCDEQLEKECEA